MKVFNADNPKSWSAKVNFVDRNNVVVGFDMGQDCCESFGYVLSHEVPRPEAGREVPESLPDEGWDAYEFDTKFRLRDAIPDYDGGGSVTFRLTAEGQPDLFLTLYNHHNGYYSHGFDMKQEETVIEEGSL